MITVIYHVPGFVPANLLVTVHQGSRLLVNLNEVVLAASTSSHLAQAPLQLDLKGRHYALVLKVDLKAELFAVWGHFYMRRWDGGILKCQAYNVGTFWSPRI